MWTMMSIYEKEMMLKCSQDSVVLLGLEVHIGVTVIIFGKSSNPGPASLYFTSC